MSSDSEICLRLPRMFTDLLATLAGKCERFPSRCRQHDHDLYKNRISHRWLLPPTETQSGFSSSHELTWKLKLGLLCNFCFLVLFNLSTDFPAEIHDIWSQTLTGVLAAFLLSRCSKENNQLKNFYSTNNLITSSL